MEYWIITDTHFGHDNIIKYCGRPPEYSKMILKNISDTVNQGEVLVHLGDFCIGNDVYWHGEFMRQSHCKKWLIRGNHDSKTNGWYLDHGWDFVGSSVGIEVFGKRILLSHIPQKEGLFDLNIHGHYHNSGKTNTTEGMKDDKYHLVMLEHHYKPVSLRSICGQ